MVRCQQGAAVRWHVLGTSHLDAPPALIEELEQRQDELSELLVEAPFVLRVVPLQPACSRPNPLAGVTGQGDRGPRERLRQLQAGVEPAAKRPQDERALRVADQDDAAAGIPVREVVAPRVPDVDVRKGVARVQRGSPIPARVTCRYIGAYTRQSCENGAAWRFAT